MTALNTIPALIKKANDSLHAARVLASERLFDFAVGRACFAMLYVAEAFLLTDSIVVREPDAIAEAFDRRFGQTGTMPQIFNRWLTEAMRLYPGTDYETETGITADIVTEQLNRARAFVAMGREELTGVTR